jgi:ketosteroid isomerase-like protein
MKPAVSCALFAVLAACNAEPRDEGRDVAAIDSLLAAHVTAVNTRDVELLLDGMAPDLVYLAPDVPPIVGTAALDAVVRPAYQILAPAITMTRKELVLRGDWAVEWGCLGGHINRADGGDPIPNQGKYLFVYQRLPDRGWRITHDSYNNGPCQ